MKFSSDRGDQIAYELSLSANLQEMRRYAGHNVDLISKTSTTEIWMTVCDVNLLLKDGQDGAC